MQIKQNMEKSLPVMPGTCDEKVYEWGSGNKALYSYYAGLSHKKILDVGCGAGNISAFLMKASNECYGITVSAKEAEIARQRMTDVIVANLEHAETLPFSKNFFDVVIFADVLEHLRDPARILKLVKPYLKDGGMIIASIPNIANFDIRIKLLFGNFDYTSCGILDNTHLRFFTLKTVKTLISSAGYSISDIKFSQVSWDFPAVVRKVFFFCEWEIRQRLIRFWPGLFATQFVIYAKKI